MGNFIMGKNLYNTRNISYIIFLLLLSNFSYAISNPYRGGDVIISMKDNSPCFSVDDENRKSSFSVVVLGENHETEDTWSYVNNSLTQPQNTSNCIKIKDFSLLSVKLDTPYIVVLDAINIAYRTDFCIAKKNEDYVLQEFDYENNQCVDKELSLWEKIKSFFNKIFSHLS